MRAEHPLARPHGLTHIYIEKVCKSRKYLKRGDPTSGLSLLTHGLNGLTSSRTNTCIEGIHPSAPADDGEIISTDPTALEMEWSQLAESERAAAEGLGWPADGTDWPWGEVGQRWNSYNTMNDMSEENRQPPKRLEMYNFQKLSVLLQTPDDRFRLEY